MGAPNGNVTPLGWMLTIFTKLFFLRVGNDTKHAGLPRRAKQGRAHFYCRKMVGYFGMVILFALSKQWSNINSEIWLCLKLFGPFKRVWQGHTLFSSPGTGRSTSISYDKIGPLLYFTNNVKSLYNRLQTLPRKLQTDGKGGQTYPIFGFW